MDKIVIPSTPPEYYGNSDQVKQDDGKCPYCKTDANKTTLLLTTPRPVKMVVDVHPELQDRDDTFRIGWFEVCRDIGNFCHTHLRVYNKFDPFVEALHGRLEFDLAGVVSEETKSALHEYINKCVATKILFRCHTNISFIVFV